MAGEFDHRDALKYSWDYFHFHASQRLTTFNFYLVICGFVIAGYATALRDSHDSPVAALLGLVLSLISFIFWKLDLRNRQMIWNAEDALKELEDTFDFADKRSPIRIFRYEEDQSASVTRGRFVPRCWPRLFTFSVCFGIVFATFAALGLGGAIYARFRGRPTARAVARQHVPADVSRRPGSPAEGIGKPPVASSPAAD